MALTNHERKWVKMPAKPPMRSGSIGRVRDSLVARFEMLVRQRATDAGLPPSEFRDWVMGIVGEGVALALRDIDRWDEHRASFLTWSFLKTRSLVNKELRKLRNQVRTGYLEMDPPDNRRYHDLHQREEKREQLRLLFDQLTPIQRDTLILKHLLGYSVTEIRELTGRTEISIYSLLQRAHKRVKAVTTDWQELPRPKKLG